VSDSEWSSHYRHDGTGGWSAKGVALIDFGRGIDLHLFPSDVQFIADWKPDEQDCAEIRDARPWTYQIDYFGLAGIIHSMLFGRYMETTAVEQQLGLGRKRYKLQQSFRRYWQQDLWKRLFDLLLNPLANADQLDDGVLPIANALRDCRRDMESWLEENSEKGVGLKVLVKRAESQLSDKRRIG